MKYLPGRFVWILVAYLAVLGYALVAWLPGIVEQFDKLAEDHPNMAYAYLGAVGLGAVLLAGVSMWVLSRVLKNTWQKRRREEQRAIDPSQLSEREKREELSENFQAGRDYASDADVSTELRQEIERSMRALEDKHTNTQLEIVAFGTISSGKSSLLNALAGREVFASNVTGGTTTTRSEILWPGSDSVMLVDTPGLGEVRGEDRAKEAAAAAKKADLVLLVADGPLKSYEVDLAEQLRSMEKRIVVCLNKEDWYEAEAQQQLTKQILQQLPGISEQDIVAVRAAEVSRTRMRVAADGSEVEEQVVLSPEVRDLADRLMQIVQRDGRELLLANLLMQSRGLVDEAKQRVRETLDRRADKIISSHMWAAGVAGAAPLPLLDIAGGSAITVKMVLELARVYKQPIDTDTVVIMLEQLGKNLAAMVGATAATPAVANALSAMLKTVPGIGTLAGGLLQGTVQALVTRWIGNVFVKYFQEEMKSPPGGLAELARDQWSQLTTAESLKKLIQIGRRELVGKETTEIENE